MRYKLKISPFPVKLEKDEWFIYSRKVVGIAREKEKIKNIFCKEISRIG